MCELESQLEICFVMYSLDIYITFNFKKSLWVKIRDTYCIKFESSVYVMCVFEHKYKLAFYLCTKLMF